VADPRHGCQKAAYALLAHNGFDGSAVRYRPEQLGELDERIDD
jgi:hypothetical protein